MSNLKIFKIKTRRHRRYLSDQQRDMALMDAAAIAAAYAEEVTPLSTTESSDRPETAPALDVEALARALDRLPSAIGQMVVDYETDDPMVVHRVPIAAAIAAAYAEEVGR